MWGILPSILILYLVAKTKGADRPKDPPPRITHFLANDLVKPGQVRGHFTLPCQATGKNLKWTWKFNDGPLPPKVKIVNDTLVGGSRDSILNVEQSGRYQCFVEDTKNKVSTFSREIEVKVTVVGYFEGKSEENVKQTVNIGESFVYNCPSHSPTYGASFSWERIKGDVQVERNQRTAISPNGTLFITSITKEFIESINSSNGIRCKISALNRYFDSGVLTLRDGKQIVPIPRAKWGTKPPKTVVAIEGRGKELYCIALGKGSPTIVWKKNGKQLGTQKGLETPKAFYNRLLNVTVAEKNSHEDNYTCEAVVDQKTVLKHEFELYVQVIPKWNTEAPASKIDIPIHEKRTIFCDAIADPPPTYSWYRDGTQITTASSKIRAEGNKLHFDNVSLKEDGVYQCVARNSIGMIVSSSWVHILTQKPSFERNGLGPFYLFRNTTGRLKCHPEAAPRPSTFRWYKDGQVLSGGPYRLQSDGTLVITGVDSKRDAGEYECYAENLRGSATAKANATVFEMTRIIIPPKSVKVHKASRVDLRCEAEADKKLKLGYYWIKDGERLESNEKMEWRESQNVLTIADMTLLDSGVFTCVAFTPDPKKSEDRASAIIDIIGVPDPPTNLIISSNCSNRTTTLSWKTGAANKAPITQFLIERKATFKEFPDSAFQVIAEVNDPSAVSFSLEKLAGAATLHFRMRAVNRFGPSRVSLPTTSLCRTKGDAPDKWPENLRGIGIRPRTLDITWTPMPRVDWNAPGLYYKLFYKKASDKEMVDVRIPDPASSLFKVPNPGYHELWEFQIQAGNDEAPGDISPIERAYSGQDPPAGKPQRVTVRTVTARSVELSWQPVTVSRGSVDGYKIYYWGQSRTVNARRRRRAVPDDAPSVVALGGNTPKFVVTNLTPYSNYDIIVKAFNNGGEGPPSDEVSAETLEAEPGPPSVIIYPFAKYILVTWKPPSQPNGIITDYQLGSKDYAKGTEPSNVVVQKQSVGEDARRKLLTNQKPESNYLVDLQARTVIGWGTSVKKAVKTVKWSAPAKPNRPKVQGLDVDRVEVTYIFGLGGGYTHEFLVMYRKKVEGETFQNTSWVNHFSTQSVEIGNLSPDLYEFKTVARNDYPDQVNPITSPASDVTEARPFPGVFKTGKSVTTPIYKSAWFFALALLALLLLLGTIIFISYTRRKGTKYQVGKREKMRAALIEDEEPSNQLDGPPINLRRSEQPPKYKSNSSLSRDSDRDSLDDYGEGKFNEDGSFIQEYGDDKTETQGERDQSALSTFV